MKQKISEWETIDQPIFEKGKFYPCNRLWGRSSVAADGQVDLWSNLTEIERNDNIELISGRIINIQNTISIGILDINYSPRM